MMFETVGNAGGTADGDEAPRRLALIYAPQPAAGEAISAIAARIASPRQLDLMPVDGPAAVVDAVARAIGNGAERLLVAGGDGTLRDAVQALAPEFPAVDFAVLPIGTGNDFARSLGVHGDLALAVETALDGPTRRADVVELRTDSGRVFFLNVANGGFGGHIANGMDRDAKGRWGHFAYWMSTVTSMADRPEFEVEIVLDGGSPFRMQVSALAVANGRFLGGGFPVARAAQLDDGLLDITLAPPLETAEFLSAGMDFVFGRESENPLIQTHRAAEVEIHSRPPMPFSVDGDPLEAGHVTFRVHPGALDVVVGPEASAFSDEPTLWSAERDTPPAWEG